MIVFSLSCYEKHAFDGWFRSADDFHSQLDRGLVECPVCGDTNIVKQLSAPRINSGAAATSNNALQTQHPSDQMTSEQMTAATAIPGGMAGMGSPHPAMGWIAGSAAALCGVLALVAVGRHRPDRQEGGL